VTAFRALLQSRREGGPHGVVKRALQELEATIETFGAQTVANTLHVMAKTCYCPWDLYLVPKLERRAEALAGTFKAKCVANMLWAYATMGLEPGAGARGGTDEGAGGAVGGGGGHLQRAGSGKHAVGVCDDCAGARGGRPGRD
jgi:hypothetical protein